jgi:hypothetical protein
VTNVKTRQSVVVRINDRGPFHSNRIIDLSYAAAARIGIASAGSGLVEVERIIPGPGMTDEPLRAAAVTVAPPPTASIQTPLIAQEPAGLWLQLGAFSSLDGAEASATRRASTTSNHEPINIASRTGTACLGPYRNAEKRPRSATRRAARSASFGPDRALSQPMKRFSPRSSHRPVFRLWPSVTPPPIAAKAFVLVDALSGQTLAMAAENSASSPLPHQDDPRTWCSTPCARASSMPRDGRGF